MNPQLIWQATLGELQAQLPRAVFKAWLRDTALTSYSDNTATISVPDESIRTHLLTHYKHTICRTLTRSIGKPTKIKFIISQASTVGSKSGPSLPATSLGQRDPEPADRDLPANCRFGIELVSFDPTQKGFVMVSNYALQFWQPYLARAEREQGARSGGTAFNLWQVLRSFPASWANRTNPFWPSIQTLANIVANGNRHKILGRKTRTGRRPTIGALTVLEQERIVWPQTTGSGRDTIYYFRVLDNLPLLTPTQVLTLTIKLRERHQRTLAKCQIDFQEWTQLTLPSLLPEE